MFKNRKILQEAAKKVNNFIILSHYFVFIAVFLYNNIVFRTFTRLLKISTCWGRKRSRSGKRKLLLIVLWTGFCLRNDLFTK